MRGRIFATLSYPSKGYAMVKLGPEEQRKFIESEPAVFVPVKGAWGRSGCTNIVLKAAKKKTLRGALFAAYRAVAPKLLAGP